MNLITFISKYGTSGTSLMIRHLLWVNKNEKKMPKELVDEVNQIAKDLERTFNQIVKQYNSSKQLSIFYGEEEYEEISRG
jgi:hypothetical protein